MQVIFDDDDDNNQDTFEDVIVDGNKS